MLHCEVLQLPHPIGCGYGSYGMSGIGVCVCVRLEKWQKI